MPLLRELVGAELRASRKLQGRSLREVSAAANIALGHLSEVERGRKEASSELVASVCTALGVSMSSVLARAAVNARQVERQESGLVALPGGNSLAA